MLFVWDQAIEKTGGYFYSRLLLAVINGTGMYITLRVFSVPFAAPLAIFEGLVAEFIPIVGHVHRRARARVRRVAFLARRRHRGARLRIDLPADRELLAEPPPDREDDAAASGGRLRGGPGRRAIGGILTAFLALPVAAVVQAAIQEYGKKYTVVEDGLTAETAPRPQKDDKPGMVERFRERKNKDDGSDA